MSVVRSNVDDHKIHGGSKIYAWMARKFTAADIMIRSWLRTVPRVDEFYVVLGVG